MKKVFLRCMHCHLPEESHPFAGRKSDGVYGMFAYPCQNFAPPPADELCAHCGGEKSQRNPRGDCYHLLWPEYLTDEAKLANGYVKKRTTVWVKP